jgi:hypothetical protein
MNLTPILLSLALAAALQQAAEPTPPELSALLSKAKIDLPLVSWCRGEFRAKGPAAYAVAVGSPDRDGRYLVLESDGTVVELESYADGGDLSCYTAEKAEEIDRVIAISETIHGKIAPAFRTMVVCGFVENTRAVCWQYSPEKRTFVQVGSWIT